MKDRYSTTMAVTRDQAQVIVSELCCGQSQYPHNLTGSAVDALVTYVYVSLCSDIKKIKMKTKLPWQEVLLYVIIWISSVSFATFKLLTESSVARRAMNEQYYQDKTDVEWIWWKHMMSYGRKYSQTHISYPIR